MIITDGMAAVTLPGAFHTAASAHLEGIDFAGKTGTAEVVGHDSLSHIAKTHAAVPNVWFVGVTPRRNPELVVAVLWQNGGFSGYPARIAAKVVSAYVEKQRRLQNNLQPVKTPAPVEVGAVWTQPVPAPGVRAGSATPAQQEAQASRLGAGHFFVDRGHIVAGGVPDRLRRLIAASFLRPAEGKAAQRAAGLTSLPLATYMKGQ